MTAPPTVDVIIDNYNYGRFLSAAIDSALAQTHSGTRVIVVDDGSTDESRAILAEYGKRVSSILQENGGQGSALNAGFTASDADIVIFLDSDDLLHPETCAQIAAEALSNPAAAKFQYRLEVIDAAGQPTGSVKPAPHLPLPSGDLRDQELRSPFDIAWLPMSGVAFPRWVLQRLLPMPADQFRILADMYLQHLAALLGPVVSANWIGGSYRIHGDNNYEPPEARLQLDQLRQTIAFAATTRHHLLRLAGELALGRPNDILSVADLANRVVSHRLDPERHPVADDKRMRLASDGVRAATRRTDVTPTMRAGFMLWFLAVTFAPRRVVVPLAEVFLFPERRRWINRQLARQHRSQPYEP
ncbi:glycosyltransferase family 2 protein [soil metagenome]